MAAASLLLPSAPGQAYTRTKRLKRLVLHFAACYLPMSSFDHLRGIFLDMDRNADGLISLEDLKGGLERLGVLEELDPATLANIMEKMDQDQ